MLGLKGIVKHTLDQTAIKRLLRENEAENWQAKLKEVIKGQRDMEALFLFIQDVFEACVEGGQFQYLLFYYTGYRLVRGTWELGLEEICAISDFTL